MTTAATEAQAAKAAANGKPTAAPGEPCEDCATTGDRLLGLFGLAVACLIGAMAIDLLSGGAVSRTLGVRPAEQEPAE